MHINIKNKNYLFAILIISATLLLSACGVAQKGEGNANANKSTKVVNVITVGGKSVFLPEEFVLSGSTVSGNFSGQIISAGDNGEVAGFISGRPAFNSESNASAFLNAVESDLAAIGALANISKSQNQADTIIAQYQFTLQTPYAVADLSNLVLTTIAINAENGSVDGLPAAPPEVTTETIFRLSITIKYYSQSEVFILVSVTSDENYSVFSSILLALGDGTNIGNKGDILIEESDSFVASDSASMSDFLFVVDNSGSMSNEQTAVSQAGDDFFSAISSTGTDFTIGVITTDSETIRGAGFTTDLATFKANIQAGTSGSATETGIWFAEKSLQSITEGDLTDGAVTNADIPRTMIDGQTTRSASLSVIIISDEESQYTRVSGGTLFDVSNNLFLGRNYTVYAIIDPSDDSSSQYDDLAIASGGSTASINETSAFPAIMDLIAANATGAASRYALSKTPVSGSIIIKVDGVEITNSNIDGWQYRASSNSIVFFGSEIPTSGSTVEVLYDRIQKRSIGSDISLTSIEGEVTLTWDAVEGASAYRVYWSTSTGVSPSNNDGVFTTSELFFKHTGLTNGITYYYVVTAIIGGQNSTPSTELVDTPNPFVVYDFDDGTLQGWTSNSTWEITTEKSASGIYAATDSVGGDYANNAQATLTSPVLNLSNAVTPTLSFTHWLITEDGYDFGLLEISTDGGATFKTEMRFSSSNFYFTIAQFNLTPFISDQVVIRFTVESDDSEQRDGWYIDNISIDYE